MIVRNLYVLLWATIIMLTSLNSCSKSTPIDDDGLSTAVCGKAILLGDSAYANATIDATTDIVSVEYKNSCITLELQYGGGCEDHEIDLVARTSAALGPADTDVFDVIVSHDNTDPCEALISDTRVFDLSRMITDAGGQQIMLLIDGWDESILIQS